MTLINILLFHPAFVHFPIAFYFLEMGLLIGWMLCGDQGYHHFSELAFEWGYKFMLLTLLTGLIAAGGFYGITGKVGDHFYAAVALFLFCSLRRIYIRKADVHARHYVWLQLGGSILGCVFVTLTAFYGGRLIY